MTGLPAKQGDPLLKPYHSECWVAMLTATIHENADHTVFVNFENEHGEFGFTLTPTEAEDLCAHIGAAAGMAKFNERVTAKAAS